MPQRVSFFNLAFLFPFGEIPTVLPMRLRFCRFIIISLSIFYVFLLCSIICSCMLSTSFSFNFFFFMSMSTGKNTYSPFMRYAGMLETFILRLQMPCFKRFFQVPVPLKDASSLKKIRYFLCGNTGTFCHLLIAMRGFCRLFQV